jgi:ABC-2 type transport system ATP-binding protein
VRRKTSKSTGAAICVTAPEITVAIQNLSRNFGDVAAVRAINLELRRGEILGLLGPNGAGKTTTMQMLTGNLAPSRGSVSICGVDLLEHPVRAKRALGYLPESPPLYRDLTVDQYLHLAAKLHRVPTRARAPAVDGIKQRCGLTDVGRRLIGGLSKGYQQRLGVAQAIVHNPDVVVLDEPTIGLDPNQIREIRGLIRELGGSHSVILSSHILPEVESVCDRVCIMHQGQIVFSDGINKLSDSKQGRSIAIGLHNPPPAEEIAGIPGVVKITRDGEFMEVHYGDLNPTEQLLKYAVERGWGLYHLAQNTASLEEVFVQLTSQEGESGIGDKESGQVRAIENPIPDPRSPIQGSSA